MAKATQDSEATPDKKTPAGWYKFWKKELDASDKRLRKFRVQGNKVVRRFLDERAGGNRIDGANDLTNAPVLAWAAAAPTPDHLLFLTILIAAPARHSPTRQRVRRSSSLASTSWAAVTQI